jgi:hypothetical protein
MSNSSGKGVRKRQASPQAPPSPILGPARQAGEQRVSLYVAANGEEVLVGLHGERLETTLVQMTGAGGLVMGVPPLGMGQGQPLHELGQVPIAAGPEQEVEVIGHQEISQQPHIEPGHGFGQDPFERGEIAVVVEDSESGVGSVQSVIDKSVPSGTSRSSH